MSLRSSQALQEESLLALAAAALHPELRRVLVFGASSEELDRAADSLSQMLGAAVGSPVLRVTLAAYHSEDHLWGVGAGLSGGWHKPGLLVPPEEDTAWRLVVIPDLTGLPLPAARACLQLLETDLGRLERHGQSRSWQPRIAWLAACPFDGAGRISRHLMDRFPVRLHAESRRERDRAQALRSWLNPRPAVGDPAPPNSVSRWVQMIEARKQRIPVMAEETIEAMLEILSPWESEGVRRHLGLSRLALALAQLQGDSVVRPDHARAVASLLHAFAPVSRIEGNDNSISPSENPPSAAPVSPPHERESARETPSLSTASQQSPEAEALQEEALPETSGLETLSGPETPASLTPFPEDSAPIDHPPAPLQFPLARILGTVRERGPILGSRPTRVPGELALVPTLFAAAPYQAVRRRQIGRNDRRLLLSAADWRAWRRAPVPEDLLVLVLDLTACSERDWPRALVPHLRDAYVDRSAVCVILVGARGAAHELRPEKVLARSVLAQEVRSALDREPGRASPLAAGLQLALDTIREARNRGRDSVLRTKLVVLTDGRGNVPLEASRTGHLTGPVGSEGIWDALQVAGHLGALDRLQSVVLDPQPAYARHLIGDLAHRLGARLEQIPVEQEPVLLEGGNG